MALKIYEILSRNLLEFYYNENAAVDWIMPRAEECKLQADKMNSTKKV